MHPKSTLKCKSDKKSLIWFSKDSFCAHYDGFLIRLESNNCSILAKSVFLSNKNK